MVHDSTLRSRSWKTFPNEYAQKRFSLKLLNGFDGELIVGPPTAKDVYRVTNGDLQRESGKPDVKFYVFDIFDSKLPYEKRHEDLWALAGENKHVIVLDTALIQTEKQLLDTEEAYLEQGYEGIMVRSPEGYYKYGRSTANGGELLKLKRFEDSEAVIIGYEEEMHNANEAKKDAFGRTERSSHQANLVGKDRLGTLVVRDVKSGVEFKIGSGFDEDERIWLWEHKDSLKGNIVKYKFFSVGVKDKPRHPVYLGPRHAWDI